MKSFGLSIALAIGLSACGGGGGTAGSPPVSSVVPPSGAAVAGLDVDEAAAQAASLSPVAGRTALQNTNWAGVPRPNRPFASTGTLEEAIQAQRAALSYHTNDNGGQAGVNLTPIAGSYLGMYAVHDVYLPEIDLKLPLPPTNQGMGNFLYSPTTKGAEGACLEVGTSYFRGLNSAATGASLYVYDFCGGPGWTTPINDAFWATYVTKPNAYYPYPHYEMGILKSATTPTTWTAVLLNVTNNKWNTLYSTTGTFSGWSGNGWSMNETHYFDGDSTLIACPSGLPSIGAHAIYMKTSAGVYRYFNNSNSSVFTPSPGATSFGAYGDCFNTTSSPSGASSPPSSYFHLISANSSWRVASN